MGVKKKYASSVKCLLMSGLMWSVVRTVSCFVPQAYRCSTQRIVGPSTWQRNYYNSQWKKSQRLPGILNSQGQAVDQPEDAGSVNSRASTADLRDDDLKEYRNKNNIQDQVVSFISKQGGIKVGYQLSCVSNYVSKVMSTPTCRHYHLNTIQVSVCTIRNVVNEMMMQHTLTEGNAPFAVLVYVSRAELTQSCCLYVTMQYLLKRLGEP